MKQKNDTHPKFGQDKIPSHSKKSLYEKIPPIKHLKSADANASEHKNPKPKYLELTESLQNADDPSLRTKQEPKETKGFMSRMISFVKERPILKSFRSFDTNFLYVMLFDVIYYAVMFLSVTIYMNWFLQPIIPFLKDAKLTATQLLSGANDVPESLISSISTSINTLIYATIALIVILIINHAIFKGLIWKKLIKKRYSFSYAWKSVIVTVFLLLFLVFIVVLSSNALVETVFTLVAVFFLFPFAVYLGFIVYPMLAIDDSLKSFFVRFWKQAFGKLYCFFLPIFFIIVLFVLLLLPGLPISFHYLLMIIVGIPVIILLILYAIMYFSKSEYKTNISSLIVDFMVFLVLAIICRMFNILLAFIQDYNLTMFRFALIISIVLFLNWSKLYISLIIRRLNPRLEENN
jgi:hypothetical protein